MAISSGLFGLSSMGTIATAGIGAVVAGAFAIGVVVNQQQEPGVEVAAISPASLNTPDVPDAEPGRPVISTVTLSAPEADESPSAGGDLDEHVSAKVVGSTIVASTDPDALAVKTSPATRPDVGDVPKTSAIAPKFDLVRVDPTGGALVAGKAAPEAVVEVLLDGTMIASVTADRRGGFVAMFDMPPGEEAHVIALLAIGPAGEKTPSADHVVVVGATLPETVVATGTVSESPASEAEPETTEKVETPLVAPTIIMAGDEGVKLLQPSGLEKARPETAPEVTLDVITYDESGEVVLAGRSEPEKHVRIYVDDAPVKTEKVEADGSWQLKLPEVTAGRYNLRVDEIDQTGKVTSRVETPFQKEEASAVRDKVAALQSESPTPSAEPIRKVTVQAGATLWALAAERYGNGALYMQIFKANQDTIRNPDLIYPGQIFDIPE